MRLLDQSIHPRFLMDENRVLKGVIAALTEKLSAVENLLVMSVPDRMQHVNHGYAPKEYVTKITIEKLTTELDQARKDVLWLLRDKNSLERTIEQMRIEKMTFTETLRTNHDKKTENDEIQRQKVLFSEQAQIIAGLTQKVRSLTDENTLLLKSCSDQMEGVEKSAVEKEVLRKKLKAIKESLSQVQNHKKQAINKIETEKNQLIQECDALRKQIQELKVRQKAQSIQEAEKNQLAQEVVVLKKQIQGKEESPVSILVKYEQLARKMLERKSSDERFAASAEILPYLYYAMMQQLSQERFEFMLELKIQEAVKEEDCSRAALLLQYNAEMPDFRIQYGRQHLEKLRDIFSDLFENASETFSISRGVPNIEMLTCMIVNGKSPLMLAYFKSLSERPNFGAVNQLFLWRDFFSVVNLPLSRKRPVLELGALQSSPEMLFAISFFSKGYGHTLLVLMLEVTIQLMTKGSFQINIQPVIHYIHRKEVDAIFMNTANALLASYDHGDEVTVADVRELIATKNKLIELKKLCVSAEFFKSIREVYSSQLLYDVNLYYDNSISMLEKEIARIKPVVQNNLLKNSGKEAQASKDSVPAGARSFSR